MAFYQEMQDMVKELLLPDTEGGLGQVGVVLRRTTPGTPNPATPEIEVAGTSISETLLAAVSGASKYADGSTILATDLVVVCGVPLIEWRMPVAPARASMVLSISGREYTVISAKGLPAAGTPAAVQFIVRG